MPNIISISINDKVYDYQTYQYLVPNIKNKKITSFKTRPFNDVEEYKAYQETIQSLNDASLQNNSKYIISNLHEYYKFEGLVQKKRKEYIDLKKSSL